MFQPAAILFQEYAYIYSGGSGVPGQHTWLFDHTRVDTRVPLERKVLPYTGTAMCIAPPLGRFSMLDISAVGTVAALKRSAFSRREPSKTSCPVLALLVPSWLSSI